MDAMAGALAASGAHEDSGGRAHREPCPLALGCPPADFYVREIDFTLFKPL